MGIKELLPIGSVVLLEAGAKKVMVCGIKQTDGEENETEYDYIGVMYPEGYLGGEYLFLFNHDDIAEVAFRGFADGEREKFIARLDELYLHKT
jgi:hypothetical protein